EVGPPALRGTLGAAVFGAACGRTIATSSAATVVVCSDSGRSTSRSTTRLTGWPLERSTSSTLTTRLTGRPFSTVMPCPTIVDCLRTTTVRSGASTTSVTWGWQRLAVGTKDHHGSPIATARLVLPKERPTLAVQFALGGSGAQPT